MTYRGIAWAALFGPFVAGWAGAAALAASPQLAAFARIEEGEWEFKYTRASMAPRSLCMRDPAVLLQLEHAGVQCSVNVIENTPDSATVRYTCPGHGDGRTTITIETPRLLRLTTQGTKDGAPFAEEYEGRRVSDCNGR